MLAGVVAVVGSKLFESVLGAFRAMLKSPEFLESARTESRFFTRNRCLSLVDCVEFLLTKSSTSVQRGLNGFLPAGRNCSKQAFSQRRRHIRPSAIRQLAELVRDKFYTEADYHTFRGCRLLAVDGTRLNLPDSAELMERYGAQRNSSEQIQSLASAVYDVLNRQMLSVYAERVNGNEREILKRQLQEESCFWPGHDIFVLDRGYPSGPLLEAFVNQGHFFVARCCTEFLRSFCLSGNDCVLQHRFKSVKSKLALRIVTVVLPNGTHEWLVTNIFDKSVTAEDFKAIYHARWGVEQCFGHMKSFLELENLSGLSEQAFLQDLYAKMAVENLAGVLEFSTQPSFEARHGQRTAPVRQNFRVLCGTMQDRLVMLLSCAGRRLKQAVRELIGIVSRGAETVRLGRSFPRKRKHFSQKFPLNQRG
ncbi:MAG: IS4 family transposase [Clostridia bacterium]|nr:IS4 family transposase [Clostridia bacterium]